MRTVTYKCDLLLSSSLFDSHLPFAPGLSASAKMAPGLQDLAGSFKELVTSDDKVSSVKQTMAATAAANGNPMAASHPLDALSPDEISRVGAAIRKHFTEVCVARPETRSGG